ncbi:flagellar filament capping protein FliD [Marivivens niveibacter]|uniref:flagellar filament capping protein FliD n=1 Tax=Marivivens niveibacter TaxID=1930667 RepID=UPI0013FD6BCB|nr:flagellar filament capping protein FliD [Marivivens niveibacter]
MDYLSALNKNGSGLNISDLTTSLVQADIAPKLNSAERAKTSAETSISAYGTLRSMFEDLDGALDILSGTSVLSATSANSGISVEVTDRSAVQEQNSSVDVINIAQRQVLEFTGFTSPDDVIGTGELTIEIGVWADETTFAVNPDKTTNSITIGEGATLDELAQALSSLDGVTARVLDRGDGTYTLGVVSEEGAGNAIRMTASADAAGGLENFDNTTTNGTKQVQAAADAMLTVDGVTIFRPSNTIDDAIDGLTLTLNSPTEYATTVSVSRDADLAQEVLDAFVNSVNETLTNLKSMTAYATEDSEAGELYNDRTVQRMITDFQKILNEPIAGHSDKPVYLSDLGIQTSRNGSLYINKPLFEQSFDTKPAAFEAVFQNTFRSDDPGVKISGTPNDSTMPGTYRFEFDPDTATATLDGTPLLASALSDGTMSFVAITGNMAGAKLTSSATAQSADVGFGRSMVSKIQLFLDEALQTNGTIDSRELYFNGIVAEQDAEMEILEEKAAVLEARYTAKFAAMEQAISELNSTGNYLTNMVESWNSD